MTNRVGAVAPVDGRFRPESISHFKEVAKNVAWLLERPVQKCLEDLARIYGYSGLYELQQVLKRPGIPGPFAPRYNYLSSDNEALVEDHDRRIFYVLFGAPKGHWREDDYIAEDKCFLVFEMGLFQEAAEHRACFRKIKGLLTYEVSPDRWPLIHGWPLGLKGWLASGYTEPLDLAQGWQKVLPRSRRHPMVNADIRWQRRATGQVRLETMFLILAPRVGGRKPNGMGKIAFDKFEHDGGGLADPLWETYCLVDWLTGKSSQGAPAARAQQEVIEAFVQRPSRATAAACEFVKDLKDPVDFRDRWAFESFKAALDRYLDPSRALFSSSLDEGAIHSLFLLMSSESADIGESFKGRLWQFNYTRTEVIEPVNAGARPTLQPVVHANGSLVVPWDENLTAISPDGWYFFHDASGFASEAAAVAFDKIYLPAIGIRQIDFTDPPDRFYSIIEIDELLVASSVSADALKSYFVHLLDAFDEDCLPDSYGYWCKTLSLSFEDEDENNERNQDGEYADMVYAPRVLLINIEGCGLTFVEAVHKNGKPVSSLKRAGKKPTSSGEALASMVIEAVKGLDIDVVVYDGEM
ncbi:hypothetical protein [Paraburkholderia youngii]|uniref:hypothetical protein n=1 Tax=Paraburkholderia youngii TaxID=2782701 RepID=UPI003D1C9B43